MRRIVVFTYLVLAAAGVTSASKAQSLSLTTNPFNEKEFAVARIAGQLVSGVQLRSIPGETFQLEAQIPSDWAGRTVCSRVVSIDGLYEASNEYEVAPDWPGGPAQIVHPTRLPHMLLGRDTDAVAVRVSPSPCSEPPTEATPAVWGGTGETPTLLVNSFQADAVYAYVGDDPAPIRCEALMLDGRSAYDTRCLLRDSDGTGKVDVEFLRIVGGKPAPPSQITLWLP